MPGAVQWPNVRIAITGNVATISPDSDTGSGSFIEAIENLRTSAGVRCLVLDLTKPVAPPLEDSALKSLVYYTLPMVCAFSGILHGHALELALSADIRVCDAESTIRGPLSSQAARQRLGKLCPGPDLSRLLEAGATISADEARSVGLVSAVTAPGEAIVEAARLARTIASRGPIATQLGKEAVWRGLDLSFAAALRFETDLTLLLQSTKDRTEGVAAFLQKRLPEFTGE